MNPALQRRCAAIQKWLVRAASDDVQMRYRVGQLLVDTRKQEQVYGANPVGQLSLALRRPVSTLYRYASVAECWSSKEMKALAGKLNVFGEPLSWSHWVELSQVRSREARERLRERTLAEGLSVRELAHAVRLLHASAATDSLREDEERIGEALEDVARSCERWSAQALAAAQTIATRWTASERTNPELVAKIRRAVRAHEVVRAQSEEALGVLRAALGEGGSGPASARQRVAGVAKETERDRPRLIAGMPP
ncbi:MAG TPA: DUF1016 N-terminal domain-containing protein [Polyangiaceae bacterium]